MQRYRIDISYDGTNYAGWQVQPRDITVQGLIEKALFEISSETIKVHGSGRTDQGVHARKQVAHFDIAKPFKPLALRRALNALLPSDIRILNARPVKDTFHARKTVKTKEYRYFIWNSEVVPPCDRLYKTHVRESLDIEAMRKAASYLQGKHDFSSFTANANKKMDSYVRNLFVLNILQRGNEVVIVAKGEGFLYKMVRSIAGFLIKVGKGKTKASAAKSTLLAKKRTASVKTAPSKGLFLWNVTY